MYYQIAKALRENCSPLVFTGISPESQGHVSFYENGALHGDALPFDPARFADCKLPVVSDGYFIERISAAPFLIILGGGHISVKLAQIADIIGFQTVVIDDRKEFANSSRFPTALSVINLPFEDALMSLDYPNAYYVIVTRGHKDDRLCLEHILKLPFSYCGMIGSHKKVGLIFQYLLEHGYSENLLSQVHAPIGLSIGANTPEEIAVSIAAELIQVKNSVSFCTEWDDALISEILNAQKPYALVTLVSKAGSSPRSPGARMIVRSDGKIISSIGGGYGEYEACTLAQSMLKSEENYMFYTCHMTNDDAAKDGMICGGTIDVLIQIIR